MGQAKTRAAERATASTRPFHTTEREQFHLAFWLIQRSNSPSDRKLNDGVFEEFQVEDLVDRMVDPSGVGVKTSDYPSKDPIRLDVTTDTVRHLLKLFEEHLQGDRGIVLHALEMRLKRLDAAAYELPGECLNSSKDEQPATAT